MQEFLLYWTTGYYFYIGLGLIVLGLITSFWDSKKGFKLATRISIILGFLFVALSAAPMSGFFFRAMGLMSLTLFFGLVFFKKKKDLFPNILRGIILFMCWSAMNTQIEYENIPKMRVRNCDQLIVLGSSLSYSDDDIISWSDILKNKYKIQVINLSEKRALLADLIEKAELIPKKQVPIIVEAGFEDIKRDVEYMEFKLNYFNLCRKLENLNAYVFMTGIPVRLFEKDYAVIQREAQTRHGGIVIPTKKIISLINNKLYSTDGRTLTQKGHEKMAEVVWNIIAPLFANRAE